MLLSLVFCALLCCVVDASSNRPRARLYLHAEPLNWTDASEFCRNSSLHLAYPHNQEEVTDLVALIDSSNVTQQVHIIFHDIFAEGNYQTIGGQPVGDTCYLQWAPGYPLGEPGYNCGGFTPEGLIDVDCEDLQPFVCEDVMWPDYQVIPGFGLDKFYPVKVVWSYAVYVCKTESAHLWVPTSAEEVSAVHDKYQFNFSWVGLHHILVDREFITVHDVPMNDTGYADWFAAEPIGNNTAYPYVQLRNTEGYIIYNDLEFFVCKVNL